MKQKIVYLLFLFLSLAIYAKAAPDFEIINFKFGIVSTTPKGDLVVLEETTVIPNKAGVMYGFVYDFIKHKKTPVQETVILQLPSSPAALNNLEERDRVSANSDNTVVVSDSLIEDPSGTWNFGLKIDKGDPSGNFVITIKHDNVVFKRIEYVVE